VPLVVGIDEAGYGPTLGPLVVGATLWNVPPQLVTADYWKLLHDCVRRSGKRGRCHLTVNDSKIVYKRNGLCRLERPVLAFARAAGLDCASLRNLLIGLGVQFTAAEELPWYRDLTLPLPTDRARSMYEAVAARLKRSMAAAGIACCGLRAAVVTEDRFNQRVAGTRNKAAVLIEHVLRLIQAAAHRAGEQDLVVRVDRLGGRLNYLELLLPAFPQRRLHVLEESEACSRYRLASSRNDWFVEFSIDADAHHLPVALASMIAKYLRELLMLGFNAHWNRWLPSLRPTAGYFKDAQRFLQEIAPVIADAGIARERFVRSR